MPRAADGDNSIENTIAAAQLATSCLYIYCWHNQWIDIIEYNFKKA